MPASHATVVSRRKRQWADRSDMQGRAGNRLTGHRQRSVYGETQFSRQKNRRPKDEVELQRAATGDRGEQMRFLPATSPSKKDAPTRSKRGPAAFGKVSETTRRKTRVLQYTGVFSARLGRVKAKQKASLSPASPGVQKNYGRHTGGTSTCLTEKSCCCCWDNKGTEAEVRKTGQCNIPNTAGRRESTLHPPQKRRGKRSDVGESKIILKLEIGGERRLSESRDYEGRAEPTPRIKPTFGHGTTSLEKNHGEGERGEYTGEEEKDNFLSSPEGGQIFLKDKEREASKS